MFNIQCYLIGILESNDDSIEIFILDKLQYHHHQLIENRLHLQRSVILNYKHILLLNNNNNRNHHHHFFHPILSMILALSINNNHNYNEVYPQQINNHYSMNFNVHFVKYHHNQIQPYFLEPLSQVLKINNKNPMIS
jgi:hypothetical protein